MISYFSEKKDLYRDALLKDVIPFWENHSIDEQYGGYFTCLDWKGNVYNQDKYIWLQARQVWTFSMLYNNVESNPKWQDIAKKGYQFIKNHGMDDDGNWYFSLNREGQPLVQPYNIFSDCFAALALNEYAKMTGDSEAKQIAVDTYHNILARQNNPKGKYEKSVPGTRSMKSFDLPMILSLLSAEMQDVLPEDQVNNTIDTCIDEITNVFWNEEEKVIHESVKADGTFADTFDGRLINPGHGIESTWFIMDIARLKDDQQLIDQAVNILLHQLDFGWDEKYSGIFYFRDVKNYPPDKLEWDQKLWWVHLEALVALSRAYLLTGNSECLDWYIKVDDYAWSHFPDPEYGEWYGYLNRRGEPYLPLKGGKWKGCFHVPRALFECWKNFEALEDGES
jgi:N-acylglucosamine 2-epimerase